MRFYNQAHRFYCGVDLPAGPDAFLEALKPYRDGLVVGCECRFAWCGPIARPMRPDDRVRFLTVADAAAGSCPEPTEVSIPPGFACRKLSPRGGRARRFALPDRRHGEVSGASPVHGDSDRLEWGRPPDPVKLFGATRLYRGRHRKREPSRCGQKSLACLRRQRNPAGEETQRLHELRKKGAVRVVFLQGGEAIKRFGVSATVEPSVGRVRAITLPTCKPTSQPLQPSRRPQTRWRLCWGATHPWARRRRPRTPLRAQPHREDEQDS